MRTLLLAVMLAPALLAQDQPLAADVKKPEALVQVEVEWVELPHERFRELIADGGAKRGAELRAKVEDLIRQDAAKSLELQVVTGASGEKLSSRSCQEFIYPTEYEQNFVCGQSSLTLEQPEPQDEFERIFTPTSFETRDIGSLLDAEVVFGEASKLIGMRLEPRLTWHTGNAVWLEHKDSTGNVSKIRMPEIYNLGFETTLRLRPGSCVLAAALSPKDGEGMADMSRKVMVFVTADLVPEP